MEFELKAKKAKNNQIIQSMESLPWENSTEFMAKQCLLTAQMVVSIFEQLIAIQHDVETLKKDVAVFLQVQYRGPGTPTKVLAEDLVNSHTQHKEKEKEQRARETVKESDKRWQSSQKNSPSPDKATRGKGINKEEIRKASLLQLQQSHHSLQTQRIALRIHLNGLNYGRWNSRRAILNSLSQLLHYHRGMIDLRAVEWLPKLEADSPVFPTAHHTTDAIQDEGIFSLLPNLSHQSLW
ncbi:PREDICTED: uncharacterized protein LOC106542147 [Thamnophis sirtalis]|uniref:Uncharacterized protein LOC106542147 n=1 Tax=Thamnophis sirtalis TaxID=35019 RepID=A0A6I9Y5M2_9SAUR|nr:PREDICTED: uncharacterized protein LOC106542147 [Thamnophis sirtalis]